MPTLRQLEIFVEAARDLNFRSTADRLSISQPAVSSQIQALERGLACSLFDRQRGRSVRLSPEGGRLLSHARDTLAASRELVAQPEPQQRKIRVGIRHYLLETRVRQHIPAFLDANPKLDVEFSVIDDVNTLIESIEVGEVDFGLYRGDPPASGRLLVQGLHSAPVSLYATPALVNGLSRSGADLSQTALLLLGRSAMEPLSLITDRLREVGITPRNVLAKTQFPHVLARWCLEGRGMAILFDGEVELEVAQGRIVKFGPQLRPLETVLLSRSQRLRGSRPVMAFLAAMMEPATAPTS
jgi:DNA-binding transcriptional LysR family regulator